MRWTPGGVSGDIEDRRGSSGGGFGRVPLGIGGFLLLLVLSFVFKRDLITPFLTSNSGGSAVSNRAVDPAQSAGEQREVQFVSFVLDDVQNSWQKTIPQYRHAKLVLFRDDIDSACGMASTASGPFYCPGDEKVYIDLAFFDELASRFGASGEFAQAYVLAHEIGHHVQKLLGTEGTVRRERENNPQAANALSVRMELQADCLAGVWGYTTEQRDLLDKSDVQAGLNAAASVGDDRIQKMATGRVMPDKFTHGTSAQRVSWFQRGLSSGRVDACDTFSAAAPEPGPSLAVLRLRNF